MSVTTRGNMVVLTSAGDSVQLDVGVKKALMRCSTGTATVSYYGQDVPDNPGYVVLTSNYVEVTFPGMGGYPDVFQIENVESAADVQILIEEWSNAVNPKYSKDIERKIWR